MTMRGRTFHLNDCTVYELSNDILTVWCIPERGARIARLTDHRAERDWLWHPGDDLAGRLHANQPADPFDASPLVGIDECMPTVAPCTFDGRDLPDHGALWYADWEVEEFDESNGRLTTAVTLTTRPLRFRRTLQLDGETVRLRYEVTNTADQPVRAIWSLHPLLRLRDGDRIEGIAAGPARIDGVRGIPGLAADQSTTWPRPIAGVDCETLDLGPNPACLKQFVRHPGRPVHLVGRGGERLAFTALPPDRLPHLGLWITRGGWQGYHHAAIEPTNAPCDRLDQVGHEPAVEWPAGSTRQFEVALRCTATAPDGTPPRPPEPAA